MSPTLEKDTLKIMKSDNPAVQRDGKLEPQGRTFSTFCNVFEVPSGIPLPWRYIVGSLLTVIYLVGAILLFSFYLKQTRENEKSTVIDDKFVSLKDLKEAENDGYICTCDFPPEIRSVVKEDTRNKTFNRCYTPEEAETVKGELNILQYNSEWNDVLYNDIISQLTNKKFKSRLFNDGLRPRWKSYELRAQAINDSSEATFGTHLADLSSKLDAMGYVGKVGYADLEYLRGDDFLTVPPGFIQARIEYNCTNCSACESLWKKYDSDQALSNSNDSWVFCDEYSSHVPGQVEGCSGFCRYFRTHDRPWGVELNKKADELKTYVDDPKNPTVIFHPRLLYANISEVEHNVSYNLTFLEVDRQGTTWLILTDDFGRVPECGENKTKLVICTGRSICEIAPTYSFQSVNSEELNAQCEFYATGPDYQINRTKCEEIVSGADLRFVIDSKTPSESVSDILCQDYKCQAVIPTQVLSDSQWTGEAALNNLVFEPATKTSSASGLCTNNYTDVLVVYEDENEGKGFEERISRIHKLNCSSGNSKGSGNSKLCWLTVWYKNMTDTYQDPWKQYNFSEDEDESGKTMFACYKFREKSFRSRMWDFFGIVSGIIGSWLLILSCIYWGFLRTPPRKLAFLFGPLPSQSDDPAPAPSVSSNIYEGEKTKSTWESRLDVETNRRMADFPSERIGPYTL
ncbi:hypothetical protein AXG93_2225s1000 [Marchantia polymorpha subsp. ruderalis]|uniref:Uncharacterized protein n=1 Tax=Marchantia polymorpha subsp. ruderalis TaxID=1480154 RepID=A0A176W3C4_MARPO|nr:hypothetical protein AXG93_2225s1000 [Marchantia polymorpha subsp. ruderalis]